jgi:endonuclease/exonuclease/phosphatase family metal-dependent hydrolase
MTADDLVLATWNVHGCVGSDSRFDIERVAAVVRELDADVVALQEVGDVRGRHPHGDQAERLSELLGTQLLYQPTVRRGDRRYGNAIVTRLPVEGSRSYDLSVKRREPRGCLRADLRLGERPLHVFALHLGLSRREQKMQAAMLLGAEILRDAAVAWPLVVAGDFNFWWSGPIARTIRRTLTDVAVAAGSARPTYPARRPFLRLDRIYVDAAWSVGEVGAHLSAASRLASDHLPLVARLRLRGPEAATLPAGAEGGAVAHP